MVADVVIGRNPYLLEKGPWAMDLTLDPDFGGGGGPIFQVSLLQLDTKRLPM